MSPSHRIILGIGIVAVAACSGSKAASVGDDQNATAANTVFTCDLSSGDLTTGNAFKLTLGSDTATIDSEDIGQHTGKLQKPLPNQPQGSERYTLAGLSDDGFADLVIPKNFRTNTRGMVHIEKLQTPGASANDFLCHPVDPNTGAPISGKGSSGPAPISGTQNATCTGQNAEDYGFAATIDIVLTADKLSLKGDDLDSSGPYDTTYKPRTRKNFVRYLVDGLFEEYATDVLVEKSVLAGQAGTLTVEAQGESFEQINYACKPK